MRQQWYHRRSSREHLVDVRRELPDTFTDDLSRNNIAFLLEFDVRYGWKSYCRLISKGDADHLFRGERRLQPRSSSG